MVPESPTETKQNINLIIHMLLGVLNTIISNFFFQLPETSTLLRFSFFGVVASSSFDSTVVAVGVMSPVPFPFPTKIKQIF